MYSETPEQAQLRSAVRKLAAGYGHAYRLERARAGRQTDELWNELGRNGYLGVNIPEEYGGAGAASPSRSSSARSWRPPGRPRS